MRIALLFLTLFALTLSGCSDAGDTPGETSSSTSSSSSTTSGQAAPPDEPQLHRIDIASFKFSPDSLTIAVGDSVEWVNLDSATHTVDSTDGGPLDSGNLAKDGTYLFTFDEAGTFPYRCDIHTSMTGSVTVA